MTEKAEEKVDEVVATAMPEEKPEPDPERNQLVALLENSSIEKTEGQKYLDTFTPFFNKMAVLEKQIKAINTDDPQKGDITISRAIRLGLKKNRNLAEKERKAAKESVLTTGRLIDNFYNIIKNSSKPLEDKCEAIEKYAETKEKARIEKLVEDRAEKLKDLDVETEFLLVGDMSDVQFSKLLENSIILYEEKIRKKHQEEEDKVALEKAHKKREEIMKKMKAIGLTFNGTMFIYKDEISVSWTDLACMPDEYLQAACKKLKEDIELIDKKEAEAKEEERLEKERLQKELEEKEQELIEQKAKEEEERLKLEKEVAAEKERILIEHAKQTKILEKEKEKERKDNEKKLVAEKAKADKILAKAKAKADKERKEQEEKLATERAERERVEAELKEKNRIEKEAAEAIKKALEEAEAKIKAEKEAKLKAPDKQKIIAFADDIEKVMIPVIKNKALVDALDKALELISKACYILKNAE